jgi:DNA-directed RNA polymerase subunit RPC12/RpoP
MTSKESDVSEGVERAKVYAENGLDFVQYEIERVISRRVLEDRINGYTLEMAQELAAVAREALAALSPPLPSPGVERLKAIEEAAKVAEDNGVINAGDDPHWSGWNDASRFIANAIRQRPLSGADQWRCVNCKVIVASATEPDQCAECRHRTFAKVDQPACPHPGGSHPTSR